MSEEKRYFVFLLDFEMGKAFRFRIEPELMEDGGDAIEGLLFDKMGFNESSCQWMVTSDGELHGQDMNGEDEV